MQLGEDVLVKLYPDIVLFYGTVYLVSVVALVADNIDHLRQTLNARPQLLIGMTTGESLLLVTFCTLLAGQFCYWYYDHGWEDTVVSSRSPVERAARSLGQVRSFSQ